MKVAFDPAKDQINVGKHGISLARAKELDFGTARFEEDDSQDYGEIRYNVLGWLDARIYSLTCTISADENDDQEIIHAISLRKATTQERKDYAETY